MFPSDHVILLMDDLLSLSLHSYETVRRLAAKSILKIMKRWPSTISKCVVTLADNLRNPSLPENAVLGFCALLSSQTVLKRLTMDRKALSSFLLGILNSSHNESQKAQKAITELFVKYNIHFAGLSRSIFGGPGNHADGTDFADLVAEIGSMGFDSSNLHWRYNLMANRILLLLAIASRNEPNVPTKVLSEIAGHFLKNLKSQLPQTRILAIFALNTLLKESPYKSSADHSSSGHEYLQDETKSSLEGALSGIFQEENFFSETLNSLSHVHIISDVDTASSKRHYGSSSMQSFADRSITRFYFDFSASWPRTPSWISLFGSDTFYPNFARIFKRLIQECGISVLLALKNALEEFVDAKERSKQCVAAEALAGVLHSDVFGVEEAWDSWIVVQLQNIIHAPSMESIPEWTASISYAVTGKGKSRTRAPLLREKIIDCLMKPLPQTVTTSVVAKRYTFLSAVLIEVSPPRMPGSELLFHYNLLKELLSNMSHFEETSNNDLSNLAKAAFELLKWRVTGEPHLRKAVPIIVSLASDPNWRTRSATLTFLRSFMYRHAFILSEMDKRKIWQAVEKLLTDNQLEIREHAAAVLAGLMKGGDECLVEDFRQRAYEQANVVLKKRKQR